MSIPVTVSIVAEECVSACHYHPTALVALLSVITHDYRMEQHPCLTPGATLPASAVCSVCCYCCCFSFCCVSPEMPGASCCRCCQLHQLHLWQQQQLAPWSAPIVFDQKLMSCHTAYSDRQSHRYRRPFYFSRTLK